MTLEELTTKLISFKTISGNHTEVKKAFDFVRKYLGKKYYYKTFCYNNFYSMLISNTNNFCDFDILFNGHMDVVKANDSDFTARIEGDKLYGRGSIDMKGQIAVLLDIFKNNTYTKHVGILLTSDEEIGGENGVKSVLDNNDIRAKIVIVPDAGENFTFVDSEKALLQLDLVTTGISAHASRPNLGKNAILTAVNVYKNLCELYGLDINSPVNDDISINLSKISSGDLYNKVPDNALWSIDIRYSNIKRKDLEKNIAKVCKANNTTYSIVNAAEEFKCNLKSNEVIKFIKSCEKFLGKPLEHIKVYGASDIHYFSNLGMSCVSINPEGYNLHADNEYVSIASLKKYEQMIEFYLNN